ncbi:hypothetical protein AcW1_005593 [Taiwanofungus camphoratus]|nr:hypothetical protein AcW2_004360 [Antrodia cinnamomea]KAI0933901.1 hypothetical protein AcV5_005919 [Antrodia cinnamomea]KAI0948306.1 hypothetical protein AcV7_009096 [Antrodia cinnamomea]KAI0957094.1 hypothetical protein AcW1_005593 [Antrodia cinnamomea]
MPFTLSTPHPLAGLKAKNHSAPEMRNYTDPEHVNQTAYETDDDGNGSETHARRGRLLSTGVSSRRMHQTQSLPPCLQNLPTTHDASDKIAIHVGLGLGLPSSRTSRSNPRRIGASYNRSSSSPPSVNNHADTRPSARVGLGLGLGVDLHIPCRHPLMSTTTTLVAFPDEELDMQRTADGADESLITYSFRPPGLSTPILSNDEQRWLRTVSASTTAEGLMLSQGTVSSSLPSSPSSTATSFSRLRSESPPGAPRIPTIDRFFSDPLYT